jgi:hypothetical protein
LGWLSLARYVPSLIASQAIDLKHAAAMSEIN